MPNSTKELLVRKKTFLCSSRREEFFPHRTDDLEEVPSLHAPLREDDEPLTSWADRTQGTENLNG